ncbi:hypothetical protein IWZ00DRAFT_143894 [Phyllosticta capitalensis]
MVQRRVLQPGPVFRCAYPWPWSWLLCTIPTPRFLYTPLHDQHHHEGKNLVLAYYISARCSASGPGPNGAGKAKVITQTRMFPCAEEGATNQGGVETKKMMPGKPTPKDTQNQKGDLQPNPASCHHPSAPPPVGLPVCPTLHLSHSHTAPLTACLVDPTHPSTHPHTTTSVCTRRACYTALPAVYCAYRSSGRAVTHPQA